MHTGIGICRMSIIMYLDTESITTHIHTGAANQVNLSPDDEEKISTFCDDTEAQPQMPPNKIQN